MSNPLEAVIEAHGVLAPHCQGDLNGASPWES